MASAFPSLPLPRPQLREPTTEPLWLNAVRVSRILYFTVDWMLRGYRWWLGSDGSAVSMLLLSVASRERCG
jgi:hypothetical protein